jgi:hypothetical protein
MHGIQVFVYLLQIMLLKKLRVLFSLFKKQ